MDLAKMGQRIRAARKSQHLSQSVLSEMLGVTTRTISSWENGATQIDVQVLVEMAKIFNLSTDYLLGLSDFTQPENNFIADQLGVSDAAATTFRYFGRNPNTKETKTLDFIVSDLHGFVDFIHSISSYFECNYDIIMGEMFHTDGTAEFKPLASKSDAILLGKESDSVPGGFDIRCIDRSEIEAGELIKAQEWLVRWKDSYKAAKRQRN